MEFFFDDDQLVGLQFIWRGDEKRHIEAKKDYERAVNVLENIIETGDKETDEYTNTLRTFASNCVDSTLRNSAPKNPIIRFQILFCQFMGNHSIINKRGWLAKECSLWESAAQAEPSLDVFYNLIDCLERLSLKEKNKETAMMYREKAEALKGYIAEALSDTDDEPEKGNPLNQGFWLL